MISPTGIEVASGIAAHPAAAPQPFSLRLVKGLEKALLYQSSEEIQLIDTGADKDGERALAAFSLGKLSGIGSQPGTSGISCCERVRPKAEYISPARPREVQQLELTAGCETREASIEQVLLKSPKKQQLDAANGQNESRNKGAL